MIQAAGQLIQQVITTLSFAVPILRFSPGLLLVILVFVTPAFLGESHFAFLGYALSLRQTPRERVMDYLRILGGSKEAAKELKLFGLRDFLAERFAVCGMVSITRISGWLAGVSLRVVFSLF